MITIEVRLYGALRRYRPESASGEPHQTFLINLSSPATVDSLGAALGIPDGFTSAAAVNGQAVDGSAPIADGDRVSLFPPSAGGAR